MTRWYVASLADGDTHLAEPAPHTHLVIAQCDGRRFRPLAALAGAPLDRDQVCPACGPRPIKPDTEPGGNPAIPTKPR
ncbi:MAG: hypothetical protein ACT4NY_17555 [Pseudonocardiales bacterium]